MYVLFGCDCLSGPTNKKLRVHLPVLAPARGLSRLRVGCETREAVAGRALVFDDSFEHEAWNESGTGNGNGNGNGSETTGQLSPGGAPGRSEVEPVHGGGRGEAGQGRDSSHSAGTDRGDAKRTKGAEGGAAPRVTLIADVWHPDLSNR